MTVFVAHCIGCGRADDRACPGDRAMTGELLTNPDESESLLLPGDVRFDDPFFSPFPELDDYEVALDLLP